jgi:hypothetical protein
VSKEAFDSGILLLFIAFGCAAPLPPAQPALDLSAIAGKRDGSMISMAERHFITTKKISEDGQDELDAPSLGVFTETIGVIDGGRYRSKSDRDNRMFTETLHEGGGQRMLVSKADNGTGSEQNAQKN